MTAKRFVKTHNTINWWAILDNGKELLEDEVVDLMNELNRLAEANEERGLAIMTYLHDNYYDIWEEVNKELFKE